LDMGRKNKYQLKRKRKRKHGEITEGEEVAVGLGPTTSDGEDAEEDSPDSTMDAEENEGMNVAGTASNVKDDDYQKEFTVLGQTEFAPLKKINVTSSWVSNATLFPSELHESNFADLSSICGLPNAISDIVKEQIKSWFPVQKSVLPFLLQDITHVPPLRPRDIAISAPTGSGKTLCYVLPILAQIGARPCGRLRALVIAPVQTLVKQIEQVFISFNAYGATISALSGATDFSKEQKHLAPNGTCVSDVIISTPGRLMDHLTDPCSGITLTSLRFLVVDEADRIGSLARQEWLEVVERRSGGLTRCASLADLTASRWAPRKILLSATLSRDVEDLHMWNLHQPRLFRANVSESKEVDTALQAFDHVTGKMALPSSIKHTVLAVEKQFHPLVLYLKIVEHDWQKVLVFTNEK
ncbi:ATP-dependent RNA helicase, partial [Trichostrongylus colubriformis]